MKKRKIAFGFVALICALCIGGLVLGVAATSDKAERVVLVTDDFKETGTAILDSVPTIRVNKADSDEFEKYDMIITDYDEIKANPQLLSAMKKCVEAGKFVFVKDYKGALERQTLVELFEMQNITGKLTDVPVDDGTTRVLLGYTVFIRPSGNGEVVASEVLVGEGEGTKKTESKTFGLSFSEQISMAIEDVQHYRDNI